MTVLYLVHYGSEVGLKGKNRMDFIRQLERNIQAQLPVERVRFWHGRLLVEGAQSGLDFSRVFGVAWWTEPLVVTPPTSEGLCQAVVQLAYQVGQQFAHAPTFAVRARRVDKNFPWGTQEIERQLGAQVVQELGWKVNLNSPEVTLYVDVLPGQAFLYHQKFPGHHGLPVGSTGRAIGLFSAGIDSVMAAWYMARRGVEVELVHFHAFTQAQRAHQGRAGRLAQHLARYLPQLQVHYFPYHLFQAATLDLPPRLQRYELVVFRRFMARVAQRVAQARQAQALFSGDSLGQVASQTMENLSAVDAVVDLPFFRPLIAFNKQEIIDQGEALGFYALVLEPYKDCCSLISRNPATKARMEAVLEIEERIGIAQLVEETLAAGETRLYLPHGQSMPATSVTT